jgi:polyhydroxybutyrate depolymerase
MAMVVAACSRGSIAGPPATTVTSTTETTAPTVTQTNGTGATTIDSSITEPDGRVRTYRLHVPAGLPGGPVPLLIALHGGTGWGTQFEANSGFDELADVGGFIVAYPDGIPIPLLRGEVWNGGHCCGAAAESRDNVDDVRFISDLIDVVEQSYSIDPGRVFATGHSNGAIMSYRLACELSDRIVAVGFQAGSLEIDHCEPDRPVSVFHIHGAADTNIPIDGGHGSGISNADFNSPQASVEEMATLDGCAPRVDSVDPVNPDTSYRIWEPCDQGTTVEMVIVAGANHAWMGHEATRLQEAVVGAPYMGYDSSRAIWDFLAAHSRG